MIIIWLNVYIVKDCKGLSDVLLLQIWIHLKCEKFWSNKDLYVEADLWCHHEEKIWELNNAWSFFINEVDEVL